MVQSAVPERANELMLTPTLKDNRKRYLWVMCFPWFTGSVFE